MTSDITPDETSLEKAQTIATREPRKNTNVSGPGKRDDTLTTAQLSRQGTVTRSSAELERSTPLEDTEETPSPAVANEPTDQDLLDSALEFCQASGDYWEKGELDNALDALDQAYSIILRVNPEGKPEILQQRDDLRITIARRIVECYTARFTAANGNHNAIPLDMNKHVQQALLQFQGRERDFFVDAYRRSGRYRPAILSALREAGLPEEISWLPFIESGFKVRALSRARALGLWQFIASTGYKFGLKRDQWVDERMDPERSTEAAIAYLRELHHIFGDWTTALAAYNCGEGTVLKSIQSQRINYLDNFWDLYEKLPRETASYVPRFLGVLHILRDPEAHGFVLPPVDDEIESEKVTINRQVHLKSVAKQIDVSYDVLEELNPALRHNSTPNRPYDINVPLGKEEILLAKMDEIPVWRPPVPAYVVHRVRTGESLSVIARRYGTSVRAIMAQNGLRNSHYLKAGWKLKIPTGRRYASAEPLPASYPKKESASRPSLYVVQKGDSLWQIAHRFGTTTKEIQALNGLETVGLQVGQVITIPEGSVEHTTIPTQAYTVLQGDSPFTIAQQHRMSLTELLGLNNLTPRSTIFPGQVLLVRAQ